MRAFERKFSVKTGQTVALWTGGDYVGHVSGSGGGGVASNILDIFCLVFLYGNQQLATSPPAGYGQPQQIAMVPTAGYGQPSLNIAAAAAAAAVYPVPVAQPPIVALGYNSTHHYAPVSSSVQAPPV